MMLIGKRSGSILAAAVILRGFAAVAGDVDFQRDVQPILAEHCLHCHGTDASERMGGLRLDLSEAALKGGDSGLAAVSPGHPESSELFRRVTSKDDDVVMPPPDLQKPLSAAQIETLKNWIASGAKYETHWAFVPPRKAPVPGEQKSNPVDSFVLGRLPREGLTASPPAKPNILVRRLYLDLIGLPPTPQELAAFEKQGFAATVESLLASERFGEKWARHWLDLARYSDTNGYEKDLQREQWSWRDWVIGALNADMPYDQFLIEQLAGDLLPNATQQQVIATGFLRNSMINEEGAIVAEQFRMVEMFDRIDALGKAALGLSVQCAQCHTHKFDPITHNEYFGIFAFLNNSYEAQSWVYTPEQEQQIADIKQKIAAAEETIRTDRPQWQTELAAWADGVTKQIGNWSPIVAEELGSISGLCHPTQEADKSILMKGHTSGDIFLIATPPLKGITGLRLEALPHGDLPQRGPGRNRSGSWVVNELEVFIQKPGSDQWEKQALANPTADFSAPEQKGPENKWANGPVAYLIDGSDSNGWNADRGLARRNSPNVAVLQFSQLLDFPEGTKLKIAMRMPDGSMLGCGRLSLTTDPNPAVPTVDHAALLALSIPAEQRTTEQSQVLFTAWRQSVSELKAQNEAIDALWKTWPTAATTILHMAEREPANVRNTHLLDRGNWDQPKKEIAPHVPKALHPFPESEPRNRLGFAKWLADERSPLTARVAVNQVWQAIFGTGLVETPEDFGTRSPMPEHQALLDWLAVDFMEHGWSRKHLIRTIVSSATYQQDSTLNAAALERDPKNRFLARGPRFRADAEVIRDVALSAAGILTNRMGGPGIIPPVPQNVLDYNYVYPAYWTAATGAERYRRAVYGFRKRSMPDPVMSNFDAPPGDFSCARRVRSNTPLSALTGMNETIFVEASRAMALRVLREAEGDDAKRVAYAFQLCTSRPPQAKERDEILQLLKQARGRIADGWLNARQITTGEAGTLPDLPAGTTPQDAAAWTIVSRVLLNLDETITKN